MSSDTRSFGDDYYSPENKTARDDEAEEATRAEAALVDWLAEQTWSDFATSLADQAKAGRTLSDKQLAAGQRMWETCKAKDATRAAAKKAEETGLDLTDIPAGYYGVPDGDTRLKVRISRPGTRSRWHGYTFVDDGAEYGNRKSYGRQEPDGTYHGDIADALEAIKADPRAAARAYAALTGRCGICNRQLEDEASVAAGIGPICAGRVGWDD